MSSVELTKKQIRSKILLKLKTQKEEERKRKSIVIKRKLFRNSIFKKAKIVMFYISFRGEVNTEEMIKAAKKIGKIIAVPACNSRGLIQPCLLYDGAMLKKGPYGVSEPARMICLSPEKLDLVIVPGIAFDKGGNRLGRGKGCYDIFLKQLPADTPSFGLAFDFQILPLVPTNKRDKEVSKVLFA